MISNELFLLLSMLLLGGVTLLSVWSAMRGRRYGRAVAYRPNANVVLAAKLACEDSHSSQLRRVRYARSRR